MCMLNCGFRYLVVKQNCEVASDYPKRPKVGGWFARWPVSLGLGVGGPGSGVSGWVLGFHHLSLSQARWGMEDRLE